jgi:hypothetical protein
MTSTDRHRQKAARVAWSAGVCLPFMRRVQWACSSRSLKQQRLKLNRLPTKQD